MAPNYKHNDFVLAVSCPWSRLKKGQVVLVKHPQYQLIIKRIHAVRKGYLLLAGDSLLSTSTEAMGWVNQYHVVGLICWRIPFGQTTRENLLG